MNKDSSESLRAGRVEMDQPCTINPGEVPATLENMSISGALVNCQYFPDDILMSFVGELVLGDLTIPGKFVRLDKLRTGIEFSPLDPVLEKKIDAFLASL